MCKKVLINPETESFINDLKREYNNSIVKPYKKTRDVLEILMKKFVLYQKVSIQKMDAITRATLETLPIKNLNVSDIYIVKDNEISHFFVLCMIMIRIDYIVIVPCLKCILRFFME